jgi:hypothetical protein
MMTMMEKMERRKVMRNRIAERVKGKVGIG